mmetsp:Transcript_7162/g.13207  ORF Transcript_7162/g.13207 Transcript_7162/m.13207 type:complete len:287 (+) Transcript_7162:483-1343(+)
MHPLPATSKHRKNLEVELTTRTSKASVNSADSVWLTPPMVTRLMSANKARNCTFASSWCASIASHTLSRAPHFSSSRLWEASSAMLTMAQHPMYCRHLEPRCLCIVSSTALTPSSTTAGTWREHISSPLNRQPSEPPFGRSRSITVYKALESRASSSGHRRIVPKRRRGTNPCCAVSLVSSSSRATLSESMHRIRMAGQSALLRNTSSSTGRLLGGECPPWKAVHASAHESACRALDRVKCSPRALAPNTSRPTAAQFSKPVPQLPLCCPCTAAAALFSLFCCLLP